MAPIKSENCPAKRGVTLKVGPLLLICLLVAFASALWSCYVKFEFGGTAILDGKLEDSQFFLERYGRYSLVSEALFRLS